MRWRKALSRKVITVLVFCNVLVVSMLGSALAESAPYPSLVISQLKITSSNGQFVTLYNTTNASLDMSRFQLAYFNNYDLSRSTSSRLIALSGNLPPHSYYMINDSSISICYQLIINSVSLGFSSTAGMVQIIGLNQSNIGGSVSSSVLDYASWSKTAVSGVPTLPTNTNAFFQRQPQDSLGNPDIAIAGAGNWLAVQPDSKNPCTIVTNTSTPNIIKTGMNQLLPATEPSATIVNLTESDNPLNSFIPATDIGLKSPIITELLPNPSGSGNDLSDEYIEIYNPNDASFDLSGFTLQSGINTTHKYIFPEGTILSPNSFTVFYSEVTSLSLSNSSSVVKLIDPMGNSISASANYSNAKDGQAWALINGAWLWTTKPTPGAANELINPPLKSRASKSKSSDSKKIKSKSVKPKKTKKPEKTKNIKLTSANAEPSSTASIQIWTLAILGSLAILYACYEYRTDLYNKIFQFRSYFRNRR